MACTPAPVSSRTKNGKAWLDPSRQLEIVKSIAARRARLLPKPLQLVIEDEVDVVCDDPEIGELKVADLAGIRVHKFRFSRQEYLIAYRTPKDSVPLEFLVIDFYQVGAHENFYAELKQYLRQQKSKGTSK